VKAVWTQWDSARNATTARLELWAYKYGTPRSCKHVDTDISVPKALTPENDCQVSGALVSVRAFHNRSIRIDMNCLSPVVFRIMQNGVWTYAIGPHFRTQQCWLPCSLRAASRLRRR
jgi:hypothetical protein